MTRRCAFLLSILQSYFGEFERAVLAQMGGTERQRDVRERRGGLRIVYGILSAAPRCLEHPSHNATPCKASFTRLALPSERGFLGGMDVPVACHIRAMDCHALRATLPFLPFTFPNEARPLRLLVPQR